ncbi:MAG TPA: DNA repair protein RecN [Nevskiaceae bacterium]
MLLQITIRNLALIGRLDIPVAPGFTVLTGETGAGKSILIDAIGLVLGQRADTGLIRSGTEQAEVLAEFSVAPGSGAAGWLAEHELADSDEPGHCVLRRTVSDGGRSRAFINDRAATLGALHELGEQLLEIFGQGESQTLVRGEVQRTLVDASGDYAPLLDETARAALECRRIADEMDALRTRHAAGPEQVDFLRAQVEELRALDLRAEEPAELEAEQRRLAHAAELQHEGDAAHSALYGGDESVYDRLAAVAGTVDALSQLDPRLTAVGELIANGQALIREAADTLRGLLDDAELDPDRLAAVERRMATLHDMARKHRIKPADLPERLAQLEHDLAGIADAATALATLEAEAGEADGHYRQLAGRLTTARTGAAANMARQVTQNIRRLGMGHAALTIAVEAAVDAPPAVHGADRVRFDFTANPGQPARPLAKVASGGELSRIGLAIAVTAGARTPLATMIFDEVDAGIGGAVAEAVGMQLAALGQQRQVLCVTHLAQVAAQGKHHLHVHKRVRDGQTWTEVESLSGDARVAELARMAGGRSVTRTTEAHARELLEQANGTADGESPSGHR